MPRVTRRCGCSTSCTKKTAAETDLASLCPFASECRSCKLLALTRTTTQRRNNTATILALHDVENLHLLSCHWCTVLRENVHTKGKIDESFPSENWCRPYSQARRCPTAIMPLDWKTHFAGHCIDAPHHSARQRPPSLGTAARQRPLPSLGTACRDTTSGGSPEKGDSLCHQLEKTHTKKPKCCLS